ncbi:molecular chaperone [Buttiauxella gaviniae]|uniref:fimbrial biogenesis chaperone n=1 Tax=Buttiauxella gaviniae TaxID=82990 RepID=UPI003BB7A974
MKPQTRTVIGVMCLLSAAVFAQNTVASGLQVSPVTLTLQSIQNADGIWLMNQGEETINAQVRVYSWNQQSYEDQLNSSQNLVISPPMLKLAPGEKQLIRVIHMGPASNTVEEAYRLSINELPPAELQKNKIQFVLHYSVPVFIQPKGASEHSAKLQWGIQRIGGEAFLEVSNQGNSHAQLSGASYINTQGRRKEITQGLLGYVLPGATMRWKLPFPASDTAPGSKLEVTINGQKKVQEL